MKTNSKTPPSLLFWFPYLVLSIMCILNLSWNITDHDDGHTLGFHALGRNESIQRSYGAYDSMCDFLISFLPLNYKLIYSIMVGSTVIASLTILYLAGKLLQKWFCFKSPEIAVAQLLFIFSMPEFIYMAFSFKSVYISLAFVLLSANILFKKPASYVKILFSAIVFGIGVSFRWNNLLIGTPLAVMLLWELVSSAKGWTISIVKTTIWGFLALIFSVIFIFVSGYSPVRIVKTYFWGRQYIEKADFQLIARVGDLSLFITPATLLLLIIAILFFAKNKTEIKKFGALVLSTFLSLAVVSLTPGFKIWAPLWISFIALFAFAVKYYFVSSSPLSQKIQAGSILFAIVINWFIGVQINTPSSNWGPGLSAKDSIEDMSIFSKNLGTDNRFKFSNVKVGFFDGFALPTSEGYRPLYGHAYALLFGKLKQLDEKLNMESENVLKRATNTNSIIYQDRINPYLLASYLRNGYQTKEPWSQPSTFVKRTLYNDSGSLTELRISNPKELFELDSFVQVTHQYDSVFLMFTFTSACNKFLYDLSQNKGYDYIKLGPMSAVVWQQKNTK